MKSINQQILEELKNINVKLYTLLLSKTNDEKEFPQDLIKLEMKPHYTDRYLFEECKKLFPIYIYDESKLVGEINFIQI